MYLLLSQDSDDIAEPAIIGDDRVLVKTEIGTIYLF